MTSKGTAILDSSTLVALLKIDDADHQKAINLMKQMSLLQSLSVFLPSEVMAETLNIIGKKSGNQACQAAGSTIMKAHQNQALTIIYGSSSVISRALLLTKTVIGGASFIDCLVMSYAEENNTKFILGFDAAFKKNGYRLPGKLAK